MIESTNKSSWEWYDRTMIKCVGRCDLHLHHHCGTESRFVTKKCNSEGFGCSNTRNERGTMNMHLGSGLSQIRNATQSIFLQGSWLQFFSKGFHKIEEVHARISIHLCALIIPLMQKTEDTWRCLWQNWQNQPKSNLNPTQHLTQSKQT